MQFQTPLIRATLIRRYKRFLADIILADGQQVTAHCANPGAMTGLMDEGAPIWVEPNNDPKRKLNYSWKLLELPGAHHVCIDTSLPNRIVEAGLQAGSIPPLTGYTHLQREVKYGENSRIDFLLTDTAKPDCYVEVKSVTLKREGSIAEFPDTVTKRGTKHLQELAEMARQGHRAVMLYLVGRTDCAGFRTAADIDPDYAAAFDMARANGVEMLCFGTQITPQAILIAAPLPILTGQQN
jgi:sugar fermentation stimulation protein A